MNCKWDKTAEDYLVDGKPCKRDDYGDPTKHCTSRLGCSQHVGQQELTCARCIGRTRRDMRRIRDIAPLMFNVAIGTGVNSDAANLAGPAANPEAWTWRKIAARQGKAWHVSLIEDDDDQHPYAVLGRWDMMIREDYAHPSDGYVTVTNAADYLDRQLHRIAQDDSQDWPLFAREIRKCRSHLENVLHTSIRPERGAPCPECTSEETGVGPRLVREYGHWCEDDECERLHYADEANDAWVCPRNRVHWWTVEAYGNWIEERHEHVKRERASADTA